MLLTLALSVAVSVSQLFNQIWTAADLPVCIHMEGTCPSHTRVGWLCITSPPPTFIYVLEKGNLYQMFSIVILLQSHRDISQECSYLIHHDFVSLLCSSALYWNCTISSAHMLPSVKLLTTFPVLCSFLSAQRTSPYFLLNCFCFPFFGL